MSCKSPKDSTTATNFLLYGLINDEVKAVTSEGPSGLAKHPLRRKVTAPPQLPQLHFLDISLSRDCLTAGSGYFQSWQNTNADRPLTPQCQSQCGVSRPCKSITFILPISMQVDYLIVCTRMFNFVVGHFVSATWSATFCLHMFWTNFHKFVH